ncbi:VOC family protein [Dongshaea marina]|uniref:VOC family protein n=1 Tax=Dongshaea marina TaxID=2047966 RepID=UPI000D3EA87D|nr:VOC family protein [Dongshaea marina]
MIDHISITVTDLLATKAFYMEHLGFIQRQYYQDELCQILILENGCKLEIFEFNSSVAQRDQQTFADTLKGGGITHFALNTDNLQQSYQYFLRHGLTETQIQEGRLGRRYFFIKDPNGIFIELIEKTTLL